MEQQHASFDASRVVFDFVVDLNSRHPAFDMPDPRAAAEEGEVEDGELPLSGSTSNGSGHPYRSTGLSINGASKKPSIQIGLNKGIPARPHVKASLFDEDSSSTRLSPGGAGLSIKGAAAGSSSGPSSASNPTNGFNIKGRSSSNNGDLSQHEGEAESSGSLAPSQNMAAALQNAGHRQSSTPIVSSHLSIKGANAAGLPPKPRTSMALPFKSKASAAKPVASGPAPNAYSIMPQQLPSNAIGKAYGNAMLVPKMAPAQPVSEPGPSYTPPRRISIPTAPSSSQRPLSPEPRPPSSSPPPPPPPAPVPSQALHAPSSASPSLTSGQWAAGAQKGKGKEEEDGEELEEGEELPDDSEDKAESHDKLALGVIPTPYQDSFATKSSDKLLMDAEDDDRRRASFGRSQGDRWESSYRSPRNSRYDERDYSSSSRRYHRDDSDRRSRRKDEDDYYYRRSGYESYEDDYDDRNRSRHSRDARPSERDRDRREHRHHDRDRSRERERERDKDYSGRDREDRSYRSSRHGTTHDRKGNVWRRGSSYSPDPDSRKSPRREPNFHDEPGAPRHFDRELASVRKSLPSTPSLPAKPVAGLPARPDSARKDVPAAVVPLPQVATPFFLPSPPPPERKTVTAWEDEEASAPDMEGIAGAGSASSNVDVKKYTLFGASPLSQYILEEKLGEGTFGVVHKARRKEGSVTLMPITEHDRRFRKALKRKKRHCETHSDATTLGCSRVSEGDVVALKKIVMHNDMDGVPITALREIRILKTLNHPNVVPVVDMAYQSGESDRYPIQWAYSDVV